MQFSIHLNCRNRKNEIDAMLVNSQNVFEVFFSGFAEIELKLNTKINTIKELFATKKKNASRMIL